jgi:hypothetical protein
MKVTGFTFIKNAIKFDFPIKEAILSILPLCDEVIVAVGDCNDGTRELVAAIHPTKITIIDTVWDITKNTGGIVLADETNKAFKAISKDSDWCFYIQGDEVFNEEGMDAVKQAMLKYKDDKTVDGLLFKYLHFYGSYDYVAASSNWYKNEIRIIKNNKSIYSYKDAQGFRKNENEKLTVKAVDAYIYHYGWVKNPSIMMDKIFNAGSLWHGADVEEERKKHHTKIDFDYSEIDALNLFKGSHPTVMKERIDKANWEFDYDLTYNNFTLKERIKNWLYKLTGKELFGYKNYILK